VLPEGNNWNERLDMAQNKIEISLILPARNEAASLRNLLPILVRTLPDAEIIIVDDGSVDEIQMVCSAFPVRLIRHPFSKGNGAAIKSGARMAQGEILVLMDADGQHSPEDIPMLLSKYREGFDMVVGARRATSHAGVHRAIANDLFSRLATWMVQQPVADLTSGFRVVNAYKFRKFLYLLPNGFSYPTTITMSFFRAGFNVAYQPINVSKRFAGKSHIRPIRDGVRFILIIIKIGTLYSPQKLFLPKTTKLFY